MIIGMEQTRTPVAVRRVLFGAVMVAALVAAAWIALWLAMHL
ncbi:hypothetical protein [Amycolatopsis sp. WQ 127309]|nr:hypothetical protein [Amycolatopsis sp. WQ 127309]